MSLFDALCPRFRVVRTGKTPVIERQTGAAVSCDLSEVVRRASRRALERLQEPQSPRDDR